MKTPTIHMNGTPRLMLLADYERAYEAVDAALDALRTTAPNGRDYYPQGPGAIAEAQHDHDKRTDALRRVYAELMEIIVVLNQGGPSCTSR